VDVHYPPTGGAVAAAVVVADRAFATVVSEHITTLPEVKPYRSGEFALRELPPVLTVLAEAGPVDLIVVDGYVHLDPHGRPGLGAHVHARLAVPVIGVAKTAFHTATQAIPVHRGQAHRPLYVTAAGLPSVRAADLVRGMAGPYRLPDALRRVDSLARAGAPHRPHTAGGQPP
jgi:deoxyribonuclease V